MPKTQIKVNCKNIFKSKTPSKAELTQKWIEIINRMEQSKSHIDVSSAGIKSGKEL
ncbi:MAG: hypothetical protein RRY79_06670 [Clostridia bacterium]